MNSTIQFVRLIALYQYVIFLCTIVGGIKWHFENRVQRAICDRLMAAWVVQLHLIDIFVHLYSALCHLKLRPLQLSWFIQSQQVSFHHIDIISRLRFNQTPLCAIHNFNFFNSNQVYPISTDFPPPILHHQ